MAVIDIHPGSIFLRLRKKEPHQPARQRTSHWRDLTLTHSGLMLLQPQEAGNRNPHSLIYVPDEKFQNWIWKNIYRNIYQNSKYMKYKNIVFQPSKQATIASCSLICISKWKKRYIWSTDILCRMKNLNFPVCWCKEENRKLKRQKKGCCHTNPNFDDRIFFCFSFETIALLMFPYFGILAYFTSIQKSKKRGKFTLVWASFPVKLCFCGIAVGRTCFL